MKLTCTLAHDEAIAIAVPRTAGGLGVVIPLGQRLQLEWAGGIFRFSGQSTSEHPAYELGLATGSGGMSACLAAREAGTRAMQQQSTLLLLPLLLLLLLHPGGLMQAGTQLAGDESING